MQTQLETRKERYYALSSRLALVDNKQLNMLLGDLGPRRGWGATHTIKMDGSKVFIKRIPITQLEYDNLYSTENLYGLPTRYNYGVGSAGFGAFRELITHIKTTNWVLDGSAANFPLMYHYRIVPFSGKHPDMDEERHKGYVTYWNGDENIDRYMRDRNTAPYEAIIFLEHFPDVLYRWLPENLDKSETLIREMRRTLDFLREQGVIHFDVHFGNIVVGDGIPYLADFGLVLDKSFTLSKPEKAYFQRHGDYDDAEFMSGVGSFMYSLYRHLSLRARKKVMKRYGLGAEAEYAELIPLLVGNIEEIHATGWMNLDNYYVAEVARHRDLILTMHTFYGKMQKNNRKDTPYPHTKIRRLLKEAGLR